MQPHSYKFFNESALVKQYRLDAQGKSNTSEQSDEGVQGPNALSQDQIYRPETSRQVEHTAKKTNPNQRTSRLESTHIERVETSPNHEQLNKVTGTTRSGKLIAGDTISDQQQPKVLTIVPTLIAKPRRVKNTAPEVEVIYKEDDPIIKPSLFTSDIRDKLSDNLKQTQKKVLKKISNNLAKMQGLDKSKAYTMAVQHESKILADSMLEAGQTYDEQNSFINLREINTEEK